MAGVLVQQRPLKERFWGRRSPLLATWTAFVDVSSYSSSDCSPEKKYQLPLQYPSL